MHHELLSELICCIIPVEQAILNSTYFLNFLLFTLHLYTFTLETRSFFPLIVCAFICLHIHIVLSYYIESFQFLCRYFIYTSKDLEEWSENPESFHHEQNLVQWTEKKRPCAEALFIVIFEKYREVCTFKCLLWTCGYESIECFNAMCCVRY